MIVWFAICSSILLSATIVSVALREARRSRVRVRLLLRAIDEKTADERPAAQDCVLGHAEHQSERDAELDSLLEDAVGQQQDQARAQWAVHELEAQARLAAFRVRGLGRGAARVPFLGSLAAAILVIALEGTGRGPLVLAGGCVGFSLMSSFTATMFCKSAARAVKKFSTLVGAVATQVETYWSTSASTEPKGERLTGPGGDGTRRRRSEGTQN